MAVCVHPGRRIHVAQLPLFRGIVHHAFRRLHAGCRHSPSHGGFPWKGTAFHIQRIDIRHDPQINSRRRGDTACTGRALAGGRHRGHGDAACIVRLHRNAGLASGPALHRHAAPILWHSDVQHGRHEREDRADGHEDQQRVEYDGRIRQWHRRGKGIRPQRSFTAAIRARRRRLHQTVQRLVRAARSLVCDRRGIHRPPPCLPRSISPSACCWYRPAM